MTSAAKARPRARAPRLAPALLDAPAPSPATGLAKARDFSTARELVWHRDGQRFVLRERQAARDGGGHIYTAYELADAAFYGVTREGISTAALRPYGRVDTRLSTRSFDPVRDYSAAVEWHLAQQKLALDLIRELCPETVRDPEAGGAPGHAVYDGPGYITMLTRPEARYAAFKAARRPA